MPKVNLGVRISAGWHPAEITGIDFKDSTKGNPMLVVELRLTELGTLINGYIVITEKMNGLADLLMACGYSQVARELDRGKNPAFELDELIGKKPWVGIDQQSFVCGYSSYKMNWIPNGGRRPSMFSW